MRPELPARRRRMIETAARLLADEGARALTARRLARELGTSTMTVYTEFGGMNELRVEVRREAFARLAERLTEVERSDDPVSDLVEQGFAYCANAVADPHLYRVAFLEAPLGQEDMSASLAAFQPLVDNVERCIAAGRFSGDPFALALQIWTATHGVVSAHLAGIVTFAAAIDALSGLGRAFAVGVGDDPGKAARSVAAARERAHPLEAHS